MDKRVTPKSGQSSGASSPNDQTTIQALLVTSEDMVEHFPEHVFSALGCQVYTAHSVPDAKALADTHSFDLALLPLQVSNRSTLWLIEEMLDQKARLGVVVVSQNDQIDDAAEAMRLGAEDCIFLPFTENRLEKTIRSVLQRVSGKGTDPSARTILRSEHPTTSERTTPHT